MSTQVATKRTVNPRQLLKDRFGFAEFRPGQQEVIEHLLAGRSAAAVLPTGGGKSLCYQLPALAFSGLTLVVSPLIALMKDQIDALERRGIAAARLDSTLSADEYREAMERVRSGALKLLYVAPERFANERFRETMIQQHVSLFAVDEAHCISEWGHAFRPDYLKLAQFATACGAERVFALTATATAAVLSDICRQFAIDPSCAVRTTFYRPNLTILTTAATVDERDQLLLQRLQERPPGPTIVYVTLQRTAEEVAARLERAGLSARPYHAGMPTEQRETIQDWFMASDRGIVVATIAFGMGIDKADIRYVYHYNLPKSLENFSQEIGRAGRDDQSAICETLVCLDDVNVLENFVHGDTPTREAITSLLTDVFALGEEFDVSLYQLSDQHDIRLLVVRTLLTYLELDGYIEGGTPFYENYQFKPLVTSLEILARFDGERREFVRGLLKQSQKKKIWFEIDVNRVAKKLNADRQRVIRALDYLAELQLLEVKVTGVRHRYRRLKQPAQVADLAAELYERQLRRESHELQRLRQVLDLARHDGCQVALLAGHFGEVLDHECGHCRWCQNKHTPLVLPEHQPAAIDAEVWKQAQALRRRYPQQLAAPRSMARLLCGVTSPHLSRARLSGDKLFGALAHIPFSEVLRRAQEKA